MRFIGFGELSYYLFFPLTTPLLSSLFVSISRSFVSLKKPNETHENSDIRNDTLYAHPLIVIFFFFISQTLAGFLELISRKLQKDNDKKQKLINPLITYNTIHIIDSIRPESKRIDFKMYYIIFGLVIIEIIGMCLACIMFSQGEDVLISQILAFQMVSSGLLSYPILNYKIYRHQFVSLVMFIIGIGSISIPTICQTRIEFIIGIFAGVLLWSFQSVTAKYLMETKFISQFMYLFIHGLMGAILIGIVLIFTPYIKCTSSYCDGGVLENTWQTLSSIFCSKYLLNFFFLMIVTLAYNTFQLTTIHLFTPTHNDASESLGSLISWIYMAYIDVIDFKFILPLQIFGYLFMIAASLMYNEIIIVYVFSLGEYTKKEIKKRSREDDKDIRLSLMEDEEFTVQ